MKLCASMLYYELSQRYHSITIENKHNAFVNCLLFWETPAQPETCYITDKKVDDCPSTCILITTNADNRRLDCDLILLDQAVSLAELFNAVQRIFQKYDRWEQSLLQILHTSGSVEQMATISTDIFNNLIATNDPSFLSIFLAGGGDAEEHFLKNVSRDYMVKLFSDFKWNPNSKEPVLTAVEGYSRNIAMNIFDGSRFLGTVSITETHQTFRDFDSYLLTIIAQYMKRAILLYGYYDLTGEHYLEKILRGMLAGNDLSLEDRSSISSYMSAHKNDCYQVIVFNESVYANDDYYKFNLRSLAMKYTWFYIHTNRHPAAILLQADQPVSLPEEFQKMLEANHLRVGISDGFSNLFDFLTYYQQASLALSVADALKQNAPAVYFNDYSIEYIIHQVDHFEVLFPSGLRNLIAHDAEGRVSYVDTLEVYLQTNGNALQAAHMLNITRNSFLSRMERLYPILNLDIDNDNMRLFLLLCIKAFKAGQAKQSRQNHDSPI